MHIEAESPPFNSGKSHLICLVVESTSGVGSLDRHLRWKIPRLRVDNPTRQGVLHHLYVESAVEKSTLALVADTTLFTRW